MHSTPLAPQAGTAESCLQAQHLAKSYGSRQVVKDVSLTVRSGEVVGLLGPNGAGKTTLLLTLTGVIAPLAGRVRIDGEDIARLLAR